MEEATFSSLTELPNTESSNDWVVFQCTHEPGIILEQPSSIQIGVALLSGLSVCESEEIYLERTIRKSEQRTDPGTD